jgi:phospholipid/cholesterol/gamma-HCH transport system permease protein
MIANPLGAAAGWTGRRVLAAATYIASVFSLDYLSLKQLTARRAVGHVETFGVILRQMLFTGVDALPVISGLALLLGWVVIIQAGTQLPKLGAEALLGQILVVTVVRELAPLLTAFVIIGRSGSAVTTELGYMRVNQELDALEAMGIQLGRFLLAPRVVGFWLATLCLTLYFAAAAVLGGYLMAAATLTIPFDDFIQSFISALAPKDLGIILVKCSLFGLVIAGVCCHHGLAVERSYTEIPQQTTRAIINAVAVCFTLNVLITILFYI